MLSKKLIKYFSIFFFFALSMIVVTKQIGASDYKKYCFNKIEGTDLYDCGNIIYTYYEDKEHSSYIVSLDSSSILYAGEKDGMDIFYANSIQYNNVSYDDRSRDNNNLWSIITSKGKMVFDGSFKDTFVDDSHSGYYRYPLGKDVYTIRQYHHDGELYRTIVIYRFKDWGIDFTNVKYDGIDVFNSEVNEVLEPKNEMELNINSKYGVKNLEVTINDNSIIPNFKNGKLRIESTLLNKYLVKVNL